MLFMGLDSVVSLAVTMLHGHCSAFETYVDVCCGIVYNEAEEVLWRGMEDLRHEGTGSLPLLMVSAEFEDVSDESLVSCAA